MDADEAQKRWQAALRSRYPGVILRPTWYPEGEEDPTPFFNVFMIPDERRSSFILFYLDELPGLMEQEGLPEALLSPVSVSETRNLYPEIYREALAEKSRTATARSPRKATRIRQTAAPKKAVSTH